MSAGRSLAAASTCPGSSEASAVIEGSDHPLQAVHLPEQPLHAVVGALREHDVGEVEEVDPGGEQHASPTGRTGAVGPPGAAGPAACPGPPPPRPCGPAGWRRRARRQSIAVVGRHTRTKGKNKRGRPAMPRLARLESGELAGEATGGARHVENGNENRLTSLYGALSRGLRGVTGNGTPNRSRNAARARSCHGLTGGPATVQPLRHLGLRRRGWGDARGGAETPRSVLRPTWTGQPRAVCSAVSSPGRTVASATRTRWTAAPWRAGAPLSGPAVIQCASSTPRPMDARPTGHDATGALSEPSWFPPRGTSPGPHA